MNLIKIGKPLNNSINESQNIVPLQTKGQPFRKDKEPMDTRPGAGKATQAPSKCPHAGCDASLTEFSILRHFHTFHPNSVDETLIRQSLQDKTATSTEVNVIKSLAIVKSMIKTEDDPISCPEVKIEQQCPPPSRPKMVTASSKRHRPLTRTQSGHVKRRRRHVHQTDPMPALARLSTSVGVSSQLEQIVAYGKFWNEILLPKLHLFNKHIISLSNLIPPSPESMDVMT